MCMAASSEARSRADDLEAGVACPVGARTDSASNDAQGATPTPAFRADVLSGLSARPRAIPARWFYDRRGSELFEEITRLPEYYLTRVERSILAAHAAD